MIAGTSWIRFELDSISWKEQKRRTEVLEHNPIDWIGTSNRLDWNPADWILKQKLQNSNQEGFSRLDDDPGDWINCLESGRNSRLQEFKNLVN